jgi:hypothetical protein
MRPTKEAPRPENLAMLSPRVLWSLMPIFPDTTDIPTAYSMPNSCRRTLRIGAFCAKRQGNNGERIDQLDIKTSEGSMKVFKADKPDTLNAYTANKKKHSMMTFKIGMTIAVTTSRPAMSGLGPLCELRIGGRHLVLDR